MSVSRLPIVFVVAVARNGIIGAAGQLPWRIKSDLRRFRAATLGKPIIMGRKTFESIGKPLDGRDNIVISTREDFTPPGVHVARSLADALRFATELAEKSGAAELCVIGGGAVFAEALRLADRIILTEVAAEPSGDVFFPALAPEDWVELSREPLPRAAGDTADAILLTLERRS